MTTYVFPGQGSQKKGMGETLFDKFPDIIRQADEILGYSIKDLCLRDPDGNLSKTQFTQPALYVVNALSYLDYVEQTGRLPDYLAGHSLGEYSALFAAGAYDFRTGLELVQKRGELMGAIVGGGMAAVIGLTEIQVREQLLANHLETVDIANYNSPTQMVISGQKKEIDKAIAVFEQCNGVFMVVPLRTSGAFHSRYMEQAKIEFSHFLKSYAFNNLKIPVISNVSARAYQDAKISELLSSQITSSVKWTESIRYLMGLGEMEFVELGNGHVLSDLIAKIQKEADPLIVENESSDIDVRNKEGHFGGSPLEKYTSDMDLDFKNHQEALESSPPISERNSNKSDLTILPTSLGCEEFKQAYQLKYAYMSGGMYKGIASKEMVIRMGQAGMMGFFGAGGLMPSRIEAEIQAIQHALCNGQPFGSDLVHLPSNPKLEEEIVDIYLSLDVKHVEAAAFLTITPALVKYKAKGLSNISTRINCGNKILAKVSRPEVAEAFLSPAPEHIIVSLRSEGKITQEEAEWLRTIPMADDICVEADSGGHTDGGVAYALMPAMLKLREECALRYGYTQKVRMGAAGGIGTPEAAAAAFLLGADFIMTGSVNQCTVEAGTSEIAKDLLQAMNVQDTEYVPAGDMFEFGAKVQVLKKGLFFPARANKLYELYRQHQSIDELDVKTRAQLEDKYFKRTFEQIYQDCVDYHTPQEILKAEQNPKHKMALIFKWYFGHCTKLALEGDEENRINFQIPCGPALGAFNQWVKGTELENWRKRHVDEIGLGIMEGAAELLQNRYQNFMAG